MCVYRVWWLRGGWGKQTTLSSPLHPSSNKPLQLKPMGRTPFFFFFLHSATVSLFFLPQPVALVIFYSLLLINLFYFFKQDQQPQSARLGFGRQRVS